MSSENSVPDKRSAQRGGPSRASIILLAVALAAMTGLVASFYPLRVNHAPAPLAALAQGCVRGKQRFISSDVTEVSSSAVNALPAEAKSRVLLYLNVTPCGCGCAQSVMACLLQNPQCKVSPQLMKRALTRAESVPVASRRSN